MNTLLEACKSNASKSLIFAESVLKIHEKMGSAAYASGIWPSDLGENVRSAAWVPLLCVHLDNSDVTSPRFKHQAPLLDHHTPVQSTELSQWVQCLGNDLIYQNEK